MKRKRVSYIGERTGDNMQVTPQQLLDMIREEIEDEGAQFPVQGMFAVVVRESEDGTLHLDNFRCGLPKFVEIAVISRTWQRIIGSAIDDDVRA